MSAELKRLVQRFYDEVLNAGRLSVLDELLTPNAIYCNPALGLPASVEGAKQPLAGLRSAFPDLRYTVENITADGDRVVVQFVLEGDTARRVPWHRPHWQDRADARHDKLQVH